MEPEKNEGTTACITALGMCVCSARTSSPVGLFVLICGVPRYIVMNINTLVPLVLVPPQDPNKTGQNDTV